MVDKGEAAGVLYVWQDEIERGVFDNPHYSFDDVEDNLGRRLAEDTKDFLKKQLHTGSGYAWRRRTLPVN